MADFTITHRIEAPEIVSALNALAVALSGRSALKTNSNEQTPVNNNTPMQEAPAPVVHNTEPAANPTPATVEEVTPTAEAPTPAPTEAPAPKTVTFEEIVVAGSQLLDAGRMDDLLALLKGFGVQAITQLKPEQYAEVATALRGLGAKI